MTARPHIAVLSAIGAFLSRAPGCTPRLLGPPGVPEAGHDRVD